MLLLFVLTVAWYRAIVVCAFVLLLLFGILHIRPSIAAAHNSPTTYYKNQHQQQNNKLLPVGSAPSQARRFFGLGGLIFKFFAAHAVPTGLPADANVAIRFAAFEKGFNQR